MLKTWLITFSLISLGCAHGLPPKPAVNLCVIDWPAQLAYCNMTNGEKITNTSKLEYRTIVESIIYSKSREDVPVSQMHKHIAFSPKDWGELVKYIHKLEEEAPKHCH